ncbi:S1 family peptidase [Ornithinibacillus sp. JPR2-1]|uniref:S1 family peptidase n=1 Tax=Ornithinibacillus sp. JPR2-1 TaxID=2094019 RepID=UPI0031E36507
MKKRMLIMLLFLLAMGFFTTSISAETLSIESSSSVPEVITLTNSPAERPQLEELKRSAERNGITFEQAIEDYLSELSYNNKGLFSEEVTTLPSDIAIDGITLSEIEDLKTIAKTKGISLEESIKRYAWQTEFLEVADKLEKSFPDTFAGAVFEFDGSGAWFAFKDDIPKQALVNASDLPATIKLYGNRGFSEKELISTLNSVHDKLYMHEDIVDASSYYDIETGKITVEAQPKEKISANAKEKMKSQVLQTTSQNNSINVEVKFVDKIENGDEIDNYLRGGTNLGTCTAAFTLRNNVGSVGLSTAGHCGESKSSRTYSDRTMSGTHTVYSLYVHQGSYGDLAMYTNAQLNAVPFFYYNTSAGRNTTGVYSPRVGVNVCNFGKETGYKCRQVHKTGLKHGSYGNQVVVTAHVTTGGDSGGPWFYGNSAVGVHSGKRTVDGVVRSRFTNVNYISSALNSFRIYVK